MKLLIYGSSSLAIEIYDIVIRCFPKKWEKIYFVDDFSDEGPKYLSESIKFSSITKRFADFDDLQGIVAVGEPEYRELLSRRFIDAGIELATIIDSTATVSPTAQIDKGSIICEMSSIHANTKIGIGVLVQPQSVIGHDSIIGNFSVIGTHSSPGGKCLIGEKVYIGMNATIKEELTIGDRSIIGMGSVVYRSVDNDSTVLGNPARVTKGKESHHVF